LAEGGRGWGPARGGWGGGHVRNGLDELVELRAELRFEAADICLQGRRFRVCCCVAKTAMVAWGAQHWSPRSAWIAGYGVRFTSVARSRQQPDHP